MRDISRAAEKRIQQHETSVRERFENPTLRSMAGSNIRESDRLRHLVDAVTTLHALEERGVGNSATPLRDEIGDDAVAAAEDLSEHVYKLIDDIVAESCVEVIETADERVEHKQAEKVKESVKEAHLWLRENWPVAERNDLLIPNNEWTEGKEAAGSA